MLHVKLPDSFLSEVDFILKDEKILLSDFHYLDLLNDSYFELNNLQLEFNSLDSLTFDRMIQLISNNKKLQSLNLKLFHCNGENMNLSNLRNLSNMINTEPEQKFESASSSNNFFNNFSNSKSEKNRSKKFKKDVIFDEGAYLLSLILKPFALNLEKLFWNLIERKIHLKFVCLNFEMPSYLSNEDKYVELFQRNLFLFLEKISAVLPKHMNLNFDKIRMKNFDASAKTDDAAAEKHSIFSDYLKRRSLEDTKKKLSFFALNNLIPNNYSNNNGNNGGNGNGNFNLNNENTGSNYVTNTISGTNFGNNPLDNNKNINYIMSEGESDAANRDLGDNICEKNNNEAAKQEKEAIELSLKNHSDDSNKNNAVMNKNNCKNENERLKKAKTIDNNLSIEHIPKNIFANPNSNFDNFAIKPNNKNLMDLFSNSAKEVINSNNTRSPDKQISNLSVIPNFSTPLTYKEKPIFEDNLSLNNNNINNNKNYEESVLSFEENLFENKINNDIALQSLEIHAKNFNLDTRKYQIIEKKFHYINLRENNLINLSLDFKFFKFSEKLFFKLIPKKVEDLKLSDLDFDSLKGLKAYLTSRRLNNLISLEVKVANFIYETPEDLDLITDFIAMFKGDKLEEFVFKTKVNLSDESLLNIISRLNGDYVRKFTLAFIGLKNPISFSNADEAAKKVEKNKSINVNYSDKSIKKEVKVNFDYNKINSILKSNELKSYYLPMNFREMKAYVVTKMIESNLNSVMNEIYSTSQCVKNTSNTSKSNSNNNYNNEILNYYGKDHQVKLLKNIRKVVDNIRSFVKIKQEKDLKIEFV